MGNSDSKALSRRSDEDRKDRYRTDDFDYGEGTLSEKHQYCGGVRMSRNSPYATDGDDFPPYDPSRPVFMPLAYTKEDLRRDEERLERRELDFRADRVARRERELDAMEWEDYLDIEKDRRRSRSYSRSRRTRSISRTRYDSPSPVREMRPKKHSKKSKMMGLLGAGMMAIGVVGNKKKTGLVGAGLVAAGILVGHKQKSKEKRMYKWEDGHMAYYESDTDSTCSFDDDYEYRGRSRSRERYEDSGRTRSPGQPSRLSRIMRSVSRGRLGYKSRPAITYPGYESPPPRYRSR